MLKRALDEVEVRHGARENEKVSNEKMTQSKERRQNWTTDEEEEEEVVLQ